MLKFAAVHIPMDYSKIIMMPTEYTPVRYSLIKEGTNPLIVLGFNPSTADSYTSDNTMDSVLRLANFNGYDGFVMLNIYPLRSTSPESLPLSMDDELYRNNLEHISEILLKFPESDILLAYGDLVNKRPYTRQIAKEIISVLRTANRKILCIRKLKSGNPKHPLYTKSTTKFVQF